MWQQISEAGITIFGGAAFFLAMDKRTKRQKVGVILGLIGQVFWYMNFFIQEQWLIGPVYCLYTYTWLKKFNELFNIKERIRI